MIFFIISLIILTLTSCNQNTSIVSPTSPHWERISGRNDAQSLERPILYQACVPTHWVRRDPPTDTSIFDTTQSICEFYIQENDQNIRLTIHTFPTIQGHPRIPPQAQIARWKEQLEPLDPLATNVIAESRGGFSGLYFQGEGIFEGKPTKVLGWSMQLASVYDRQLSLERDSFDRYKRADYTIKVIGPPDLINKHHLAIVEFAHSFELIQELPSPL